MASRENLGGSPKPGSSHDGTLIQQEKQTNGWNHTTKPNTVNLTISSPEKPKIVPVSTKQWERVASDEARRRNGKIVDNRRYVSELVASMDKTDHRGRLLYPHQAARLRAQQHGPATFGPTPMRDPDLGVMKIPRPDGRFVSPPPSIPSVSSFGHDKDPPPMDGGDGSNSQAALQTPDIRGKIAPMHQLESHNGKWVDKSVWDASNEQDATLVSKLYVNPWIGDWVKKDDTASVSASFLYELDSVSHCHSDVNTYTGKLLNPVDYPWTCPDYYNEWADSADHQMTCTSSLYIQKKTMKQPWNRRAYGPPGPHRPPLGWTGTVASTVGPHSSTHKEVQPAKHAQKTQHVETSVTKGESTGTEAKPKSSETEVDPYEPLVKCHIRPAMKADMQSALDIYNWEVMNGDQALDTKCLELADFESLLQRTRDAKLPFIIIASGVYAESEAPRMPPKEESAAKKKWEAMYPQIKLAQQKAELLSGDESVVLAFGFLTVRQPGLTGSLSGSSRRSGLIRTFVHPEYRGKKLGEACVDTLLSMASHRYCSKLDLFRNTHDDPVYQTALGASRDFVSVFFEYHVPRLEVVNEAGKAKFVPNHQAIVGLESDLKSRFKFWKVARLDGSFRIDPADSASTRDRAEWSDTLVFEHVCHPEGLIFGNA